MSSGIRDKTNWVSMLNHDPVPALLGARSAPIRFFAGRDLGEARGEAKDLWEEPVLKRLVGAQQRDGSWRYHGGNGRVRSAEDYDQIETYRVLRVLVEDYGLNKEHRALRNAAEYLFGCQTAEGDFRGICGRQYVPYYSGAIMELLIKAGYSDDTRIEKGLRWLLSSRQEDGGWAFPVRTLGRKLDPATFRSPTIHPDRSKPSSHMVTGMVLRAFAAHPSYRRSKEARKAGALLSSRLWKADGYPDRQAPGFWTSFSFPFWFTDLLSSLDSLSQIGFRANHPQIAKGLSWFIAEQKGDGLWHLRLRIMARVEEPDHWISLAICRVFRRFYG